jgi:hypothetical protein
MEAGQYDALHRLVGTTGWRGSNTDRDDMWGEKKQQTKEKGIGDAGCTDFSKSYSSVVQGEVLQHNRTVLYTGMVR